ncbi:MAG: TlpA family protein disulfide reductase [Phycisphaerae bacterium]
MRARWLVLGAALCVATGLGPARATQLGDPAPPLRIAQWIKGKAVDLKAGRGKQVFVIEFWATWCPPCRKAIPHLSEIQKKYRDKGVVVVGITEEEPDIVKPFVKEAGDNMDYTVAVDRDGAMDKAYMEAFGIDGIPHAFIVDKEGRIAWHGHPETGMDKALEEIIAGKYDLETARREDKARRLGNEYFDLLVKADEARTEKARKEILKKAGEVGAEVVKQAGRNADLLNGFAWTILTAPRIKVRDLDLALKAAKAAYDASEGRSADIADTYARALFDTGRKAEAVKYQKKAVELCKDEKMRSDLKKTLERYEKEAKATEKH